MQKRHEKALNQVIRLCNYSGNYVTESFAMQLEHLVRQEGSAEFKYEKLLDFVIDYLQESAEFYNMTVDRYEDIVFGE